MLHATGKHGDRSVDLALSPEDHVLLCRNERGLWELENHPSTEECFQTAEHRFGVTRDEWHLGEFSLADKMQICAISAWAMARSQFQIELDYSEQSIHQIEQILGRMYDQRPTGLRKLVVGKRYAEQLPYLAQIWGAYIGEVMRRAVGGQWEFAEKLYPGQEVVALKWDDENMCFPVGKVHKRLTNGPEDSVASFYRVIVDMRKEKGN